MSRENNVVLSSAPPHPPPESPTLVKNENIILREKEKKGGGKENRVEESTFPPPPDWMGKNVDYSWSEKRWSSYKRDRNYEWSICTVIWPWQSARVICISQKMSIICQEMKGTDWLDKGGGGPFI